jgi:endonuclease-3 related protein
MKKSISLEKIYDLLMAAYGPQGWWPLASKAGAIHYDREGYHKGDYTLNAKAEEKFEIVMGAVLTQNTSWFNVQRTLQNLARHGCTLPEQILMTDERSLAELIRSSGYYNEKAKKLRCVASAFLAHNWLEKGARPQRQDLLDIWGVGEETADSILVYAFGICSFVVDTYTRRLLVRLGMIEERAKYADIQQLFEKQIRSEYPLYNEYHALLVEHAKIHCRKKPLCTNCPLTSFCSYPRD